MLKLEVMCVFSGSGLVLEGCRWFCCLCRALLYSVWPSRLPLLLCSSAPAASSPAHSLSISRSFYSFELVYPCSVFLLRVWGGS